jgi:GTP-binding protein HflX
LSARTGAGLDALRTAIAEIATAESFADRSRAGIQTRAESEAEAEAEIQAQEFETHESGTLTADDWYAAPHEPRKQSGHDH